MNLLSKLSALLILITIISSCKKNDPQPDNNIYWKVNGISKIAQPDASWYDNNTFMLEATSGKDYIDLFIDSTFHTGLFAWTVLTMKHLLNSRSEIANPIFWTVA